jgi:NAD(P)-dependent dehydrogenase (short-subunit alcohol dehydrogenase family)
MLYTALASGLSSEVSLVIPSRSSAWSGLLARRRAEEIANAALFLLYDEASFVSGAALPVDRGAAA